MTANARKGAFWDVLEWMLDRDTPRLGRMFEVNMRSHLTDLIPPIGFESLYDLATAHETHYTQLYTYHKKKFHTSIADIDLIAGRMIAAPSEEIP